MDSTRITSGGTSTAGFSSGQCVISEALAAYEER